jgi:glycosyltransferase involved in cell wall biosynthesis
MRTVAYIQATSEVGGSDIALWHLVSHLDRTACRPIAVLPAIGPLVPKLEAAGCKVLIEPMVQLRPVRQPGYQARYLIQFWPTVFRIAGLLRRERVDLVHTNSLYSLYGGWAARLAGVPHVWHMREIPELPSTISGPLYAMVLGLSAGIITMTDAVAEIFGPRRSRSAKIQTIYDGVDLNTFNPNVSGERIRKALGLATDTPLVGFVARLDPWKGVEVFIQMAAEVSLHHPAAHFMVCGGQLNGYQDYARQMERLAEGLGLAGRMHFTGWTYRLDDIPEVMAALDVLVHSPVRPEPFGLVLVEAMATGKPVVASRAGGIPEVVEADTTGILFGPGDWGHAANAVLDLLGDRPRAVAMGQAGRRRAERLFEVGAYAARVEAFYESMAGRREQAA